MRLAYAERGPYSFAAGRSHSPARLSTRRCRLAERSSQSRKRRRLDGAQGEGRVALAARRGKSAGTDGHAAANGTSSHAGIVARIRPIGTRKGCSLLSKT